MNLKKLFSFFSIFVIFSLIVPKPMLADGIIMPPDDYYIYESDQKAFIISDEGVEQLIISISVEGNAEDFGWLIPVPNQPTVNKVESSIFDKLATLTEPKQNLYQKLISLNDDYFYNDNYYGDIVPLSLDTASKESTVTVVSEERVGVLDVAVLEAEDVDDLQEWLDSNGYNFPTDSLEPEYEMGPGPIIMKEDAELEEELEDDATEVSSESSEIAESETTTIAPPYYYQPQITATGRQLIQDYLDSDWYFVVAKINDSFAEEYQDYTYDSYGYKYYNRAINPIRISFETSDMVFPMKITSLQGESVGVDIYTLTDSKYYVSNYNRFNCSEKTERLNQKQLGYSNENLCSDFPLRFGDVISKDDITNLTKDVAREPWFQPKSSMYLALHRDTYLASVDMKEDVLFEDQNNSRAVNNGSMTLTEWIKLPFAILIYGPAYVVNLVTSSSIFGYGSYDYMGSMVVVLVGFALFAIIISFLLYLLLRRCYKKKLRILIYMIQFPFVCISVIAIGVLFGLLESLFMKLLNVGYEALIVNSFIVGGMSAILSTSLFYRFTWRKNNNKQSKSVKKIFKQSKLSDSE